MDDTNGNLVVDGNETATIVVGMRRGGRNYYALDVTDPKNPTMKWVIRGGIGEFAELGQTWSTPAYSRMRVGGEIKQVLVFAAGYDERNDNRATRGSGDAMGRGLFVVDAETGALLANVLPEDETDLDYAMPSDVNVVDVNFDGLADYVFVGDMGGQLWRFDVDNSTARSVEEAITGGVIADFASAGQRSNRRFYYPPDVALIKDENDQTFLNIAIGSGWRAHPLDVRVDDRFYVLRDASVQGPPRNSDGDISYTAISESDLTDASSSVVGADSSTVGWYLNLPADGEKVLGGSATVNGQVLFTSYVPENSNEDDCLVSVGGGRFYALDIFTGGAVIDSDGTGLNLVEDRSFKLPTPGIPPPVSVLLLENDKGVVPVSANVVQSVDFGPGFKRTWWAEH